MESQNEGSIKAADGTGRAVSSMRCISSLTHEAGEAEVSFYGMISPRLMS